MEIIKLFGGGILFFISIIAWGLFTPENFKTFYINIPSIVILIIVVGIFIIYNYVSNIAENNKPFLISLITVFSILLILSITGLTLYLNALIGEQKNIRISGVVVNKECINEKRGVVTIEDKEFQMKFYRNIKVEKLEKIQLDDNYEIQTTRGSIGILYK